MEIEEEQLRFFFTETQREFGKSEGLPVERRLCWITDWMKESGVGDEALMFAYFNECMRVATGSRGVTGAYFMANHLHWHVVQVIRKLHEASRSIRLPELPADPTLKEPLE